MSGHLFYDKLRELKYPKLTNFSPGSFDWLFDNEESLEFLTWFCKSVDSRNFVSQEELDRFEELKRDGKVLEGRLLKEALENYCGPEESGAEIEEEIKQLQQKKKCLLEQKQLYTDSIQLYNLKQQHIDKYISSKKDEAELEAKAERALKSFNQECLKLGEVLHHIQTTTTRLEDEVEKKFLCAVPLDAFNETEENIFQTLMHFAKKHFQELDEVEESLDHQMEQGVTKCNRRNQNLRETQNLLLCDLQEKLPRVIEENIFYQVESEVNSKLVETLQLILKQIAEMTFPSSSSEIMQASAALEKKLADTSEDVQFLKHEVKGLAERLAELKCSAVTVEDQKIRLLRQQHFMKQQHKFIQLQSQQWAREQLLLSALRFERSVVDNILDSRRALCATIAQSASLFSNYLPKMVEYNTALEHSLDRTTIPRSDVLLISIVEMLSLGSPLTKEDGIYDYEDLVSLAKNRSEEHLTAVAALRDNLDKTQRHIKQCKGYLSTMEEYCLNDSQIAEFSPELHAKLEGLSNACNKFSLLLKPLQKSFRNKLAQSKSKRSSKLENAWISFYRQLKP